MEVTEQEEEAEEVEEQEKEEEAEEEYSLGQLSREPCSGWRCTWRTC